MGSGTDPHAGLSRAAGRLVASLGAHLLTGGGGGVMAAVSSAFCETPGRRGLCIGILKGEARRDGSGGLLHESSAPNPWVELPIRTHLPLSGAHGRDPGSRNHLNVLSADVLLALPGGAGTLSEVTLRIDYGLELILFPGGETLGGLGPSQILALARRPGQVRWARELDELDTLLRESLRAALADP